MALSKLITVVTVALALIAGTSRTCMSQSLEFVNATGSGGVGFGGLSGSTRISNDEFAYIDEYGEFGDIQVNRKYLITYQASNKSFSRKELRYFRGSKLITAGIVVNDEYLATIVTEPNNFQYLYVFDDQRNFDKKILLPTNITGDIEAITKNRVRVFASTEGQNKFYTIDLRKSAIAVTTLEDTGDYIKYRRFGGVDYLLSRYTSDGSSIGKLHGTKLTQICGETGEITGFSIDGETITYAVTQSDGPALVMINNGVTSLSQYPGPHGNGYFSYTGRTIVPSYIFPLSSNRFLVSDSTSIAIIDDRFNFYERYGSMDSFVDSAHQHAISENGDIAIGRVGYVSISNKSGNFSIPCLDTKGHPANITAVAFLPNGDVVASYWGNWDIFRIGNETGVILISINERKVKKRFSTPNGLITDVAVNGQIYYASDGLLYHVDPEFRTQPKVVQVDGQMVDLYRQASDLYVRSINPNRIQKLSKQNVITAPNMFGVIMDYVNLNIGSNLTYFGILTDESLLGEFVGYVTNRNQRVQGMYLPQYIGNGSGDNIIVGNSSYSIILKYRKN